jgi:DNA-binding response OmpR family regulator
MTKGLYVSAHPDNYFRLQQELKTYSLQLVKEHAQHKIQDVQFIIIDCATTKSASLVREYRSVYPQAYILVLSAKKDEEDLLEAFSLGADDYQRKPCSDREVATRIRVMLRRKNTFVQNKPSRLHVDEGSCSMEWEGIRLHLTKLECKLLDYLLSTNKIISREQIVQTIWEGQLKVNSKVIDVHIYNLRKKLQQATNGQVTIRTVTNKGFTLSRNVKQ